MLNNIEWLVPSDDKVKLGGEDNEIVVSSRTRIARIFNFQINTL
ncbi:hypothetical protein ES703_57092 [subsurface metagenome]